MFLEMYVVWLKAGLSFRVGRRVLGLFTYFIGVFVMGFKRFIVFFEDEKE